MGKSEAGNTSESTDAEAFMPLQLDRFVPYRLGVLSLAISRSLARLYARRFRLSVPEWRAMAALGSDQPLSANDVCRRTHMDKVQVSRALTRLLAAGLATRRRDEHDRRRSELWLSEKGMAMYRSIVPLAYKREAELLAVLDSAERQQLDGLLRKLTAKALELEQHD